MGWISADALKLAIKDQLATTAAPAGGWDGIAARAVALARADLRGLLLSRGYSPAQVDAWDDLATYHTAQSIYRALCEAGATKDWDDKFINSFDMREALASVVLAADDAVTQADRVRKTSSGDVEEGRFSVYDGDLRAWERNKPRRFN